MSFLLLMIAPSRTNIDSLQVLYLMELKHDRVYTRGHSKSVSLFARQVIGSEISMIPSKCHQALPLHHELHALPELRLKWGHLA